jgi:hypothetical protein
MAPTDALVLDNFICRPTCVELRKGQQDHVTAVDPTEQVYSLLPYRDGGTGKLFAGLDSGIYDVTAAGAMTVPVAACTSGKWESLNAANAGIRYLVLVNGVDLPKFYDGTTWQTAVITGVANPEAFTTISQFKFRIFLTQADSLSFWYLAVNAVQGAATEFPLAPLFTKGGALVAANSWTVDTGIGADDYAVFMTSEGEVAVYKGIDPSNAATWELVGVYSTAKPVGKKCLYKYNGELLLITDSGLISLSKLLQSSAIDRTTSITDKAQGEISNLALLYGSEFGWELVQYSLEDLLILNSPNTQQLTTVQFAMNTITGAWSKFRAMPANCFAEFNGNLYYGSLGKVAQALTGEDDFGANITATAKTSFNYFGMGIRQKHVKMLRPNFYLSKKITVSFALSPNFQVNDYIAQSSTSPNGFSLFDISLWDQAVWSGDTFTDDQWRTVAQKPGYCMATLLQLNDKDLNFQWNSTDYLLAAGSNF